MKKIGYLLLVLLLSLFVTACSGSHSESSEKSANDAVERDMGSASEEGKSTVETSVGDGDGEVAGTEAGNRTPALETIANTERKIIYTANLQIEVKEYQQALEDITEQVTASGGYIVSSTMYEDTEADATNGELMVRIPQDKYPTFIDEVEQLSSKVLESSVTGQDVTEEYIDLESRLKSKRVVEARLLTFMEQAEKTEDLLAISDDLAAVQEDIETIIGQMNYLANRSDLATITINMYEKNVTIGGLGDDELNTWEKTVEQLKKSVNFLLHMFSGLVVLLIGNIPIFIILGAIAAITFYIVKKQRKKQS
ncbi:DUF4349 domain-containing protein [Caldibacillus lycopersici]|uniref:DUF4349 domain-containing protein n=1 Tax=Perspicuibacillus lycopersici TaxID=1325689 RepID=A0AAE3IR43_9BACI|nr:DUF4349 domain-containing protein [Perspicuibacillus lycopersici]MCU9613043.1 DUF4349 domain-containing protein [Perspicuibacillus lycopersici]